MSSIGNIGSTPYTAPVAKTAAVQGLSAEEQQSIIAKPEQDTYTRSSAAEMDAEKVASMKAELKNNVATFRKMVESLFTEQGKKAGQAGKGLKDLFTDLLVDEQTKLDAQAAIAEDGYWGVEQTAQRILDFAKALSGGDSTKAAMLKGAVLAGFGAAEKVWGGNLPDICYQTRERILEGFAEWENEGAEAEVEAE